MENFNSLGLPESLLHSLTAMGFTTPTPIQAQAIPVALKGQDVLGSAQTGTGKTAAFSIPLVCHLLASPNSSALVLTPTRELATQVLDIIRKLLGRNSQTECALLIGGDSMFKQLKQLKSRPRVVVGTPGRINDHLARGTLRLDRTDFVVFDETDRMLDMGFTIQLEKIAKFLPEKRQSLLFSATFAPHIMKTAERYLNDAVRISVGSITTPIAKIKQEIVRTTEAEKYGLLLTHLEGQEGSCLVFVKTKYGTEKLADKLRKNGHSVDAIHGDLRQNKRDQVIRSFRDKRSRILVATDVAARGLDISHIECVVNYDLPQCPEDYIHRIGRTGRAGAEGTAISLLTSADNIKWKNICRLINPDEVQKEERAPRGGYGPKSRPQRGGFQRDRKPGNFERRGGQGGGYKGSSSQGQSERRSFGDRKPNFGERKPSFGGDRREGGNTYQGSTGQSERRIYGDRPSYGDRKPAFGERREKNGNTYEGSTGQSERRSYGDRSAFGERKPTFGDRKPTFGDRREPGAGYKGGSGKPRGEGRSAPQKSGGFKPAFKSKGSFGASKTKTAAQGSFKRDSY